MALIVQKYGGSSVGTTERIRGVAKRLLETQQAGNQVIGVVSAMAGVTDHLLELAGDVSTNPPEREMDVLLSTGEQTTIALMAMAITEMGGKAVSLTGAQAGISTDGDHTRARISNITPDEVHNLLRDGNIVIVAGFQGQSPEGRITTLGRGGSDLTAIAIASAVGADTCQILTDVDGVYTCDPRVVKNARKIDEISYDEMLEMASSGSKVMQSRSVEFAKKFAVHFEVRSSMNTNPGTVVIEETMNMESVVIRGVSLERDQAEVTIQDVPNKPGIAAKVFEAIAEKGIMVDMIAQNFSRTDQADISFTLHRKDLPTVESVIRPILNAMSESIQILSRANVAKLSAVGIGMRSHSGVASQMFAALADAGINIRMITTSEIKISVTVAEEHIEEAANVLHNAFDLQKT